MEQSNAKLRDIINYEPEMYLSKEDCEWIKSAFKDGPGLKILRKVFLPSVGDLELTPEEFRKDAWLMGRNYAQIPDAEVKTLVLARQEAIEFVMGALIHLKVISNTGEPSPMQMEQIKNKNSAK